MKIKKILPIIIALLMLFVVACTEKDPTVTVTGIKDTLYVNEVIDLSEATMTIDFKDGPTNIAIEQSMLDQVSFATPGEHMITVSYTVDGKTYKAEVKVEVINKTVESIEVTNQQSTYTVNEKIDLTKLSMVVTYTDLTTKQVAITEQMLSSVNLDTVGETTITVRYNEGGNEYTDSFTVNVISAEATFSSIECSSSVTQYIVNQPIDLQAISVEAVYSDGTKTKIAVTEAMASVIAFKETGKQTLTLTIEVEGKEYTKQLEFDVVEITSISTIGVTYTDKLNTENGKLVITLSNQQTIEVDITSSMYELGSINPGTNEVEFNFTYYGLKLSAKYEFVVEDNKEVATIELITTNGNIYIVGSSFDFTQATLKVTYTDDTTAELKVTEDMLSVTKFDEADYYDVVVSYKGVEIFVEIISCEEDEYESLYQSYLDYLQAKIDISDIIEQVKQLMPEEATEDLQLYTPSNERYVVTYSSDNTDIIGLTGLVTRQEESVLVKYSVTVRSLIYRDLREEYSFEITVPGLGPVILKDITNRKLVFAYTYAGTGTRIREDDYKKIDVINYCFAHVSESGVTLDSGTLEGLKQVLKLRREAGIRIVLSLGGGGSGSLGFSPACLTPELRTKLVQSLMDLLKKYNLDGFDLDWEYPGWTGLTDSHPAVDKDNFTDLVKKLRIAMDAYKPGLLLTSAVIAGAYPNDITKFYDLPVLNSYMNYLHLMTYDLNDSSTVTHNSNLYSYSRIYSGDNSVKIYSAAGFSKEKLVIGAAFYGKNFTLNTPTTPTIDVLRKSGTVQSIQYTVIKNTYMTNSAFKLIYDSAAQIHFLTDGKNAIMFEGIDDMKVKTQYVYDKGIAGIMFWDYGSDSSGDLLNAIYTTIRSNEN